MPRVFIGIGSNVNPEANLRKSLWRLSLRVRLLAVSTVYRTRPEGGRPQPDYLDCVAEAETALSPAQLKHGVLHRIENELGRTRGSDSYASRTCDLDLLLYGDTALRTAEVIVPDPNLTERPYLVAGVLELAPDATLPGGLPLARAARALPLETLAPVPQLTSRLRKEILNGR